MVAVRAAVSGLSAVELEQIRDSLAAGRKPKVVFTEAAGQIAGQLGQVVALTDPAVSEEWVVVRFGRDELPFSPADVAVAPKAPPRRAAAVPVPREEIPLSEPVSVVEQSPVSPAEVAAAGAVAGAGGPVVQESGPGDAEQGSAGKAAGLQGDVGGSERSGGSVPPPRATPAKKAAAKVKAPAGLTVTLQYADGEWTVAANQGAKALAKPYVIKASEALRMVGMLDVPGVHEAVEEIVAVARAEAEAQAGRLRAELAEIEARLAELREAE